MFFDSVYLWCFKLFKINRLHYPVNQCFLLEISIDYTIPNSPHPMLTYCLNPTFSWKQSPLKKNINYSVYSVPKDLTRCNNIPQSINTSTKVMLLLPNDTKLSDIHLQFPSEHAHDDTVQRIFLSSRQGQQHPLVVASVGNPDQPNNQNFTLEKQTFSPTKVKIGVSGTHHPQLVSRLTHMTPALK